MSASFNGQREPTQPQLEVEGEKYSPEELSMVGLVLGGERLPFLEDLEENNRRLVALALAFDDALVAARVETTKPEHLQELSAWTGLPKSIHLKSSGRGGTLVYWKNDNGELMRAVIEGRDFSAEDGIAEALTWHFPLRPLAAERWQAFLSQEPTLNRGSHQY